MMKIQEKLVEIAKKVVAYHHELYEDLSQVQDEIQKLTNEEDQADIAYFMRHINKHNEEVGKFLRRLEKTAEKLCCLLWSQKGVAEPIRTDYCTASPHVGMSYNIPHHEKNPEEYAKIMEWLGVPKEQWSGAEPTISLRWNGIIERFNEAGREGKPFPDGLDPNKKHPTYSLRIRKTIGNYGIFEKK